MPTEVMTPSKDHAEEKAKIINRLKRLEGQVRGLQAMVEEERDCHDILTLVSGIRSALNATGDIILATYLEKCQTDLKRGRANIDDLVEAVRLARG
jgi:CsoR family transcriptional regulator, copper-sensing transcriptional repressor